MAEERLTWFHQAKVGMFIHWGPYSLAGVEASWPIMVPEWAWLTDGGKISEAKYVALAQRFNPTSFDAREWVRIIKDSGLRYLIFTSKHHDGFCMFDAPGTEYKITNTPFGRDIVGELAEACGSAGLRFGLYYSPPDMHHPGYRDTSVRARKNWYGEPDRPEWREYLDYMRSHVKHLLTSYGPISVIWFDGLFDFEKYEPASMHELIASISPDTLVNDRIGSEFDFITPEQGIPKGVPVRPKTDWRKESSSEAFRKLIKALRTPVLRRIVRQKVRKMSETGAPLQPFPTEEDPPIERFQPWETCMTMNRSWGYNPTDREWKSVDKITEMIELCTSRGGNFLLNVGPTPEGVFPDEARERLTALGLWLENNGKRIYGVGYREYRPARVSE